MQTLLILLILVTIKQTDGSFEYSSENTFDFCEENIEIGLCNKFTVRYHFDHLSSICKKFIYSGCHGNRNNFKSLEQCRLKCHSFHASKKLCTRFKRVGVCNENLTRFWFDHKKSKCEPFKYNGCGGNANNFRSINECEHYCGKSMKRVVREAAWMRPKLCSFPADKGNCAGNLEGWFYNISSDTCERFFYGGCKGNKNNFGVEADCIETCHPSRRYAAMATTTTQRTALEDDFKDYYEYVDERFYSNKTEIVKKMKPNLKFNAQTTNKSVIKEKYKADYRNNSIKTPLINYIPTLFNGLYLTILSIAITAFRLVIKINSMLSPEETSQLTLIKS